MNKAVETFAGDADAETKAIINEDIDSTIASQVSLNQATSAFATQIISNEAEMKRMKGALAERELELISLTKILNLSKKSTSDKASLKR